MTAHAYLSASGAHRWLLCPGAPRLEAGAERVESEYAAEGTRAHEIAHAALSTGRTAAECAGPDDPDEMPGYVQQYVDFVNALPGHKLYETRVDFSPWVADGFGTADAIAIKDGIATVVDLKYGKGVPVYAEENPQAMLYALGTVNDLAFLYEIDTVRVVVFQPRIDNVSEWTVSTAALLQWAESVVRPAAAAAMEPDAPCVPGEKQCRFCDAKSVCAALASWSLDTALGGFGPAAPATDAESVSRVVGALTPDELADAYGRVSLVETWLKGVKAGVLQRLHDGREVPGYKLVAGRANRDWVDVGAAERMLKRVLGAANAYEKKLLSPAKAEKALGVKKDGDKRVNKHVETVPGSPTVATASDPRPAIQINPADGFDAAA